MVLGWWQIWGARYAVTARIRAAAPAGGVLSVQVAVRWPVWFCWQNHTGAGVELLALGDGVGQSDGQDPGKVKGSASM